MKPLENMEEHIIPENQPETVNEQPVTQQEAQTYVPPVQEPIHQQPVYQEPVYQQSVYTRYTPQQPPVKPKKDHKTAKKVFSITGILVGAVALSAVVALITAAIVGSILEKKYDVLSQANGNRLNVLQEQVEQMTPGYAVPDSEEPVTDAMQPSQVYAQTVESVVAIASVSKGSYYGQAAENTSTGSGVILSADGYIATNYHVVEGGTQIYVTTNSGDEHEAKLVGYDAANDIAVLKVEAKDLPFAAVGSSDALKVGDKVAAIGNPLGELTATMTVGYISAKDRMVSTDGTAINMLQTDAAINSGNSGGPLFDMYGKVVGITTAKYSGTSNSGASIEGIGFAIPIDDVVDIIDDLMNYGYITGAYLGVMVRDLDSSVASTYGLPLGVYVDEVTAGYCAEAAGVQAGDIIIDLGGHKVSNMSELTRALRKFNPGDETTITVFRSGAQVHLTISLSEKPAETEQDVPEETQPQIQETVPYEDPFGGFMNPFFGWGW